MIQSIQDSLRLQIISWQIIHIFYIHTYICIFIQNTCVFYKYLTYKYVIVYKICELFVMKLFEDV